MTYTITVKNNVTTPQLILEPLQSFIGRRTDCELSPYDGAGLTVANEQFDDNLFREMVGIGIGRRPTAEIMRETRGKDSMR